MSDPLVSLIRAGLHRDGLEEIAKQANLRVADAPAVYGIIALITLRLADAQDDQGVPATEYDRIASLADPMVTLVETQSRGAPPEAVLEAMNGLMLVFRQLTGPGIQ